jgi:hypothetical protein
VGKVQNCDSYVIFKIVIQYFDRPCSLTVKIKLAVFRNVREVPQRREGHDAELGCFILDGEIEGDVRMCLLVISIDPFRSHVERASRGWNLG